MRKAVNLTVQALIYDRNIPRLKLKICSFIQVFMIG